MVEPKGPKKSAGCFSRKGKNVYLGGQKFSPAGPRKLDFIISEKGSNANFPELSRLT
jgi:hypothetical protein